MGIIFIFYFIFYLFIFGCVGSSLRGLSLVAASGGYSLHLQCTAFSLQWLLLLWLAGSRAWT